MEKVSAKVSGDFLSAANILFSFTGSKIKGNHKREKYGTCKAQFEIDPTYSRAGQHAEAG